MSPERENAKNYKKNAKMLYKQMCKLSKQGVINNLNDYFEKFGSYDTTRGEFIEHILQGRDYMEEEADNLSKAEMEKRKKARLLQSVQMSEKQVEEIIRKAKPQQN